MHSRSVRMKLPVAALALTGLWSDLGAAAGLAHVNNVKVVSDKVEDVSTLEALLGWMTRPGMSDKEKALAVWETVVKFRHQDSPPNELREVEGNAHDPIKTFNVYGYGMCCCASSHVAALARAVGLKARGKGISAHSVPEVYWDGDWHLLDSSLICYFHDETGDVASVDEIIKSVRQWYAGNPGFEGDEKKLRKFMRNGGWRKGPKVLATCEYYDANGWLPAATHGWYSTMAEYTGKRNFVYEYGYTLGYRALFKLRRGERLTRNWFNKGLHVNMDGKGGTPGSLKAKVGRGDMRYSPRYGDVAPGRVGNGTLFYRAPLSGDDWRSGAWSVRDVAAGRGISPASTRSPAEVVFRMHCPYVFLGGKVRLAGVVGTTSGSARPGAVGTTAGSARPGAVGTTAGSARPGAVGTTAGSARRGDRAETAKATLYLSTNNALDWKEAGRIEAEGEFRQEIDLGRRVLRRYDYYVKLVLEGRVRIDELEFESDVQHSQRALPALTQGRNVIAVSAGPATDTITVEPSLKRDAGGKIELLADYRPVVKGVVPDRDGVWCASYQHPAVVTIPVETPGDIAGVRFGGQFRARDAKDGIDLLLSFDDGASWVEAGSVPGPYAGFCRYVDFADVPGGSRKVLVRYRINQRRNTAGMLAMRADVDYWDTPDGRPASREAHAPLKVTYVWQEAGVEKRHVHLTREVSESYEIRCASAPKMRSIVVELAEPR